MYASHALECNYNCGDFVKSLMIALRAHVIKPCAYSIWNVERSWPGFENEGSEREMTEKHAVSRPGCISKHQELVRQVSEGQSDNYDNRWLV